jgi:hypothetical protein
LGLVQKFVEFGKSLCIYVRREFGHFELIFGGNTQNLNEFSCALGQIVYQEKLQSLFPGINPE